MGREGLSGPKKLGRRVARRLSGRAQLPIHGEKSSETDAFALPIRLAHLTAFRLNVAARLFALQPLGLADAIDPRLGAFLWLAVRIFQQLFKLRARRLPVGVLRAVLTRCYQQIARSSQLAAREITQPGENGRRQSQRIDIDAQLYLGRDFIGVLTARARSGEEALFCECVSAAEKASIHRLVAARARAERAVQVR